MGDGIGEPAGTEPVFVGVLGDGMREPVGTSGACRRGVGSLLVLMVWLAVGVHEELLGGVDVGVPGVVFDPSFADLDACGA